MKTFLFYLAPIAILLSLISLLLRITGETYSIPIIYGNSLSFGEKGSFGLIVDVMTVIFGIVGLLWSFKKKIKKKLRKAQQTSSKGTNNRSIHRHDRQHSTNDDYYDYDYEDLRYQSNGNRR